MLTVINGGQTRRRCKVLRSFARKLQQRRFDAIQPSGPCCPWPCPFNDPIAA